MTGKAKKTSKAEERQAQKDAFWGDRLGEVNDLLDKCIADANLKNDAALSRHLGVAPPVISKLRWGKLHPGASFAMRIHRRIGMSVDSIYEMLYLPRDFDF
jgi:hypothetical protein